MRTVKPAPVDRVTYEPVMLAVSKARALLWTLTQLGEETAPASDGANNLLAALRDAPDPEDVRRWLHIVIADALETELDTIEGEYRKLGTNGRLAGGTISVDEIAKAGA